MAEAKATGANAAGRGPLTPYFTVEDADLFLRFIGEVFGARVIKQDRYDDGRIQHARTLIGPSMIMVNSSSDDYRPQTSQMHLQVADVAAAVEAATALGAQITMPINTRPHGEIMAGFTDPCGNLWWVAQPA